MDKPVSQPSLAVTKLKLLKLLKRREKIEQKLCTLERVIYDFEGHYLDASDAEARRSDSSQSGTSSDGSTIEQQNASRSSPQFIFRTKAQCKSFEGEYPGHCSSSQTPGSSMSAGHVIPSSGDSKKDMENGGDADANEMEKLNEETLSMDEGNGETSGRSSSSIMSSKLS